MANDPPGKKIPIDLVYTYVDGDAAHTEKRRKYMTTVGGARPTVKEAYTRFRHVGEIRFSVRSAMKYMPWLRRIFIVTDSQFPPVDAAFIENGKVRIVDHRDIIPVRYLPTFNPVTIESFLHRIDGLSEIFLYNNDDFMHFAAVPKNTFVACDEAGNVNLNLYAYPAVTRRFMHLASRFLPSTYAPVLANSFTQLISNTYRLLKSSPYRLGWNDIIAPRHFTHVYRVGTARRIEEEFADSLSDNRLHRFVIPGLFWYSPLAYTLERKWNPGDCLCLPGYFSESAKFEMYDFTALFSNRDKLWRKVSSSRTPFACLNNIPMSDKADFERVMREKGFGNPCDESRDNATPEQEAG